MTFELGRSLLLADAVTPDELARALLLVATQGVALPRALLASGVLTVERLELALAEVDAPVLRHVVPVPSLVRELPAGMCDRLLAIPVRRDERTGMVDVAVADARDTHAASEIGYWLKAPVRLVRASLASMEAALARMRSGYESSKSMRAADAVMPLDVRALAPPMGGAGPNTERTNRDRDSDLADDMLAAAQSIAPVPSVDKANLPIPLTRITRNSNELGPITFKEFPTLDETLPDSDGAVTRRRPIVDAPPPAAVSSAASTAPRPPFADVGPILDGMKTAESRDAAIELLLRGIQTVAGRVALLLVRRDEFVGWRCTREFGDERALKEVSIPLSAPTILALALAGGTHLGQLLRIEAHEPLFAVMKTASDDVAVTTVTVDGRPALVVIADDLGDSMLGTRRIEELAREAGDALARIVRKKLAR